MKPEIGETSFGSIMINEKTYNHDIIIRRNGTVEKRKKKLSKVVYGTSHSVALDEIKYVYEEGTEGIVIGSGQYGVLDLSDKARKFLVEKHCDFKVLPTPQAIEEWNRKEGEFIGLFHITC